MQIIKENSMWTEIVKTKIKIESVAPQYMSTAQFVKSNKAMKLHKGEFRTKCNCCKKKWEKITGKINLVLTNKGNKVICDQCLNDLDLTKTK